MISIYDEQKSDLRGFGMTANSFREILHSAKLPIDRHAALLHHGMRRHYLLPNSATAAMTEGHDKRTSMNFALKTVSAIAAIALVIPTVASAAQPVPTGLVGAASCLRTYEFFQEGYKRKGEEETAKAAWMRAFTIKRLVFHDALPAPDVAAATEKYMTDFFNYIVAHNGDLSDYNDFLAYCTNLTDKLVKG
jgi:hypothetical protein